MEKGFRKVELPEPEELAHLADSSKSRVKSISRSVRCYCWHPSGTKQKKLQLWREVCFSTCREEPTAKQKIKEGWEETGKGSIAMARNVKKLGCVSQDVDSSSQTSLNSIVKKDRRSSRFDLRLRYSPRRFWKLTACPGNAL